jgi:hypothetical protein
LQNPGLRLGAARGLHHRGLLSFEGGWKFGEGRASVAVQ